MRNRKETLIISFALGVGGKGTDVLHPHVFGRPDFHYFLSLLLYGNW